MPETAEVQFQRILHVFALAAREGGAALADLARAVETDEAGVLADLQEVTSRADYFPGGYDDHLGVIVEHDRVQVWWNGDDVRPPRLSPAETLALGLGLRVLASEADGERRASILALARELEALLAAPDPAELQNPARQERRRLALAGAVLEAWGHGDPYGQDPGVDVVERDVREAEACFTAEVGGHAIATGEDETLALLADAARDRERCRIRYARPGDAAPSERGVAPYRLVYAEGRWYLLAHDDASGEVRIFRVDRVASAARTADRFEVPEGFDPAEFIRGDRVFRADEEVRARVRYSPHIASWILERRPAGAERAPDGSVVITHDVADARWLVQHVLQYGPDAEVLDPPELRRAVAALLGRLAARG